MLNWTFWSELSTINLRKINITIKLSNLRSLHSQCWTWTWEFFSGCFPYFFPRYHPLCCYYKEVEGLIVLPLNIRNPLLMFGPRLWRGSPPEEFLRRGFYLKRRFLGCQKSEWAISICFLSFVKINSKVRISLVYPYIVRNFYY